MEKRAEIRESPTLSDVDYRIAKRFLAEPHDESIQRNEEGKADRACESLGSQQSGASVSDREEDVPCGQDKVSRTQEEPAPSFAQTAHSTMKTPSAAHCSATEDVSLRFYGFRFYGFSGGPAASFPSIELSEDNLPFCSVMNACMIMKTQRSAPTTIFVHHAESVP